ncbi:TPA: glutaredoxin [Vibrio vulnificus]|jgi:glutaredoxin|nr:glutaredoxin [Vibrio vulnificus]
MKNTNALSIALYHTSHCPYCAQVRKVINELNTNIVLHDIYRDTTKAKELVKSGGKRQVPCLRINTIDGQAKWLYESQDIINYLRKHSQDFEQVA